MIQRTKTRCRRCKAVLTQVATGRLRRFCSGACRQASYRRRARQSVHFSSRTCEWPTPPDLFARLHARYDFTLDPCATVANTTCARYFTRAEDGLAQEWSGRVFCNPPYGAQVAAWVEKAWKSAQSSAELVVLLLPARTDTRWWHTWCARGEIEFLPGRLRFGNAKHSAPFPSALVIFRNALSVTKQEGVGLECA